MKISKKYSYYFILGLMFLCTILLRVTNWRSFPISFILTKPVWATMHGVWLTMERIAI